MLNRLNSLLSNNYTQLVFTLGLAVLTGVALHPMPEIIYEKISKSFSIKLIILVLLGFRVSYPLDLQKIIIIIMVSSAMLIILDHLRKYDKKNKSKLENTI